MPEHSEQASRAGPLLAFDVGAKMIGVALGSELTAPRPLRQLKAEPLAQLQQDIDRLIAEWRPSALLVGRPLTLEGDEQPASRRARCFAEQLRQRHRLPVTEVDERHSTRQARERFAAGRSAGSLRRKAGTQMDAMAAAIIMERYLATATDR